MMQSSTTQLFNSLRRVLPLIVFGIAMSLTYFPLVAATPVILIGPDLKPRQVNLQALGDGRMSFFDAERTLQVESVGAVLQIRFPVDAAVKVEESTVASAKPQAVFIELIDGQRIVGKFLGSDDQGQKLRFQHAALAEVTISLDKVARLSFDGVQHSRPSPREDVVRLTNGDELTGFVLSVKEAGIEVQQGKTKPFVLPGDRVTGLHLANPMQRPADRQHLIWLRDGSRVLASEVTISAEKFTLSTSLASKSPITLPLAAVARIELASLEGRLIDLAELPLSITAGGKVFGVPMSPRIEGDMLRLHAPITVEFTLPAGAKRFAAIAELDAEGEDVSLADFLVSVLSGSETTARHAITGKQPRAEINAALTGKTLTITLDPAAHGPVLDRLRLRDAVVFVEAK